MTPTDPGTEGMPRACPTCAGRARLLAALAGRLEHRGRDRERLSRLLSLPDAALVRALELPGAPASGSAARSAPAVCRHHPDYPQRLRDLTAPPAVLHLAGPLHRALVTLSAPGVAIVGPRAPSDYGREVARALASGLAASGVCVISGMAMGIDAIVHEAALAAGGPTLAVLPGGVDVPYPAGKRALHARLAAEGALVSELPAGTAPWRWMFVARNRIVAALATVTVVVEARERSGTLITAGFATDLGREVAAVPGPVTASRSDGTNALIRDGAHLVRNVGDVLDLLYGVGAVYSPTSGATIRPADGGRSPPGARQPPLARRPPTPRRPPESPLPPTLAQLLARVRAGHDTPDALVGPGRGLDEILAGLTELELLGRVRRGLSGRYFAVPNG